MLTGDEIALQGSVLSPSRIGDVNRSRVLQALCDNGPLTRAELARLANVPRATISGIVKPLLESGLLHEGDPSPSDGKVGKPGRPLWFRSGAGLSGAVSLGPEGIEAALVSASGEILERSEAVVSDPNDVRTVHRDIIGALARVLPRTKDGLFGIGVAVPGVCDAGRGVVIGSGQIPALNGHALGPTLQKRMRVRVVVDNDSRAQALGEKWFGEARGLRTFCAIQTGHGLGVGIVIGGSVYRGEGGQAGELGHSMIVADGEKCFCGLRGCWETVATLHWMRREAKERGITGASKMGARELAERAQKGDESARELLEKYADHLALGLANLMQLLAPQRIILHGDVVGGGEVFRRCIEERTRARALPFLRDQVAIAFSSLDTRAALLGAAGLVLSDTFNLAT